MQTAERENKWLREYNQEQLNETVETCRIIQNVGA
jgi:hypothetical protein